MAASLHGSCVTSARFRLAQPSQLSFPWVKEYFEGKYTDMVALRDNIFFVSLHPL